MKFGVATSSATEALFSNPMRSLLTMLVCFVIAFPVGTLAALYLEEYAPQNRLTDIIEVSINNLAAVPSIIFGLLALALFINLFGICQGSPLVGGLTLALMTMPVIVIAGRNAIKSVPPSIRDAALGIGASPIQVVFHHVLPLAMPGIMTGTILDKYVDEQGRHMVAVDCRMENQLGTVMATAKGEIELLKKPE